MNTIHIGSGTKQVHIDLKHIKSISTKGTITLIRVDKYIAYSTILAVLQDDTLTSINSLKIRVDLTKYEINLY